MQLLKPVLRILKNKYVIAALAFAVWMLFFDEKDWGTMRAKSNKYTKLRQSEKLLAAQINDTKKELWLLQANAQTIEKYARENFYMKKDNEDLFIVKSEGEE